MLVADDVLGTAITTGSLPSIPLSLEGEVVSRPSSKRVTSSGVVRWLSTGRRGP